MLTALTPRGSLGGGGRPARWALPSLHWGHCHRLLLDFRTGPEGLCVGRGAGAPLSLSGSPTHSGHCAQARPQPLARLGGVVPTVMAAPALCPPCSPLALPSVLLPAAPSLCPLPSPCSPPPLCAATFLPATGPHPSALTEKLRRRTRAGGEPGPGAQPSAPHAIARGAFAAFA